jgi:hypothetical protein
VDLTGEMIRGAADLEAKRRERRPDFAIAAGIGERMVRPAEQL